jgi:predicted component of type VI protein secretion system
MNASLVLLRKNGACKDFPLSRGVTVIGRRGDCDLRIPLPVVSREHCQLSRNEDSVKLRDLGSRGGTFVNGKRVDENKEVPVKAGDYIRIGPLTFVCRIDGKPEKIVAPAKAAPQKPKPQPKPQKAAADIADADDDLADLDVSGSFINLDESDSDLEDLKDL